MIQSSDTNNELQALISLLDEPDQQTYDKVREHIFVFGSQAVPMLEKAWENSFNELIQQRIENIIHEIQLEKTYHELHTWASLSNTDPLEGFLVFSRYQYPHLDADDIKNQVNRIKRDAWLELNNNLTPLEKIKVLNHIIFDIHQFKCIPEERIALRPLFINNLLETRSGNAHSLGMLYSIIARQLDLPVYGLVLPAEKFILVWVNRGILQLENENYISFYINPENNGSVFTRNEIVSAFKRIKLNIAESAMQPMDDVTLINRFLDVIKMVAVREGDQKKIDEIDYLKSALE